VPHARSLLNAMRLKKSSKLGNALRPMLPRDRTSGGRAKTDVNDPNDIGWLLKTRTGTRPAGPSSCARVIRYLVLSPGAAMRRRSRAGGEPVKARRRKAATLKRRTAPKAVRSSSDATHQTEMARVIRERDELLEQRTAISDILRVISNSPSDVQPVLDTVAEHAARICEAQIVDVTLIEKDRLRIAATFGQLERPPGVPLDRSTVSGRSVCDRQAVHVVDLECW
jgi:hypothetical protein